MGKNRRKYKSKFFPFSAGIPWKIERGKYIIPEIDSVTWCKVTEGRDIIITAFGGILESFFSLSIAEAISSFDPSHKLYWLGEPNCEILANAQGLCKVSDIKLTKDILGNYPVPLFFDKNNNVYINALNNFLVRKSYLGKYPEQVDTPVVQQIFQNSMIPWNDYTPKMRKIGSEFYDELIRINRIHHKSKIITIIQNTVSDDVLQWNNHNIKEFAQLARLKGFKIVLFTKNRLLFHGTKMIVHEYNLRNIIQVIQKSWMVLSTDVNWLLISLSLSNAKIISKHIDGAYNLFKNAEFLKSHNDIFTDQGWVSPIDAFTICEGFV